MAPKKLPTSTTNNASGKGQLCLKLLINRKSNPVIFAEAGKDTVNFLFNFLQLPVGSVIRLLSTTNMVGSVGNIFQSMSKLDDIYVQSTQIKDSILNSCTAKPGLLTNGDNKPTEPQLPKNPLYECQRSDCFYYSESYNAVCCRCKSPMDRALICNPSAVQSDSVTTNVEKKDGLGIVKELVTYMIMDDLNIMPMSTVSGLTQLSKFGVKHTGLLEEQVVSMGVEQGLALLKASFESKTVLTDVFLANKGAKRKR